MCMAHCISGSPHGIISVATISNTLFFRFAFLSLDKSFPATLLIFHLLLPPPLMSSVFPPASWGGRWSAVHSLWSYAHRFLDVFGVAAVDKEELSLLSGPLVHIQCAHARNKPLLLSHHPDHLHPDEPIGWVHPGTAPLSSTLFFLHFDPLHQKSPNHARIATAAPSDTTPRAWIAINPKTGLLMLSPSDTHAAIFHIHPYASTHESSEVTFQLSCTAGLYLSIHEETMRARICASHISSSERFFINNIPLPPTLSTVHFSPVPQDVTMAAACCAVRTCPVRLQSRAFGWFLASKPGVPLAAATSKDSGWDGFLLEYDSLTQTTRIRDSRGLYISFTPCKQHLVAAATESTADGTMTEGEVVESESRMEIFYLEFDGNDGRIAIRSRKGYISAARGGHLGVNQDTVPGKREHFYLRIALPSMMDQSSPRLRVRSCAGGARQVEASVVVPASANISYQVLCDYDGLSSFLEDASESRVLERKSATELIVRMVQCHSFLILTLPMTLILSVVENPSRRIVTMNLKSGLGIKEYKGVWQAVEQPDGRCLIRCTLVAAIAVPAPGFLMDGIMTHATRRTMEQLRIECIKRSTIEQSNLEKKKKHISSPSLPSKKLVKPDKPCKRP